MSFSSAVKSYKKTYIWCREKVLHPKTGISHLNSRKDKYLKRYISNDPSCECGAQDENPEHYLLFCPRYSHERINLRNKIQTLDITDMNVTDTLLSGNQALSENVNRSLFKAVMEYIVATKCFSRQ